MADYQLDSRPYFQILHNLLRHSDLDYEPEDTAPTVDWISANAAMLRKVLSKDEFGIIHAFWTYWDKHTIAPTPEVMRDLIHTQQQCEGMLNVLDDYKLHYDDLEVISALDLPRQLDLRQEDYEKWKLTKILSSVATITVGSLQMEGKGVEKKILKGPRDALSYLHEAVQKGILLDDVPAVGGVLSATAPQIKERYTQSEAEARNNNLFIPTGIRLIDGNLGGLRRKELNGVLGFVGQRKSGIIRTMGYNAAMCGFRVLHIPLESDYGEEESVYAVMHANVMFPGPTHDISKSRLDRALLTPEDKKKFFSKVIPDYNEKVAQRIVVYSPGVSRSWEDVKSIIQRETAREQVDLVLIDYLTMLSTPGNRDDIADKIAIIQDAKRLAMTANEGKGLCIVTPVQGNRNGFDTAATNDGAWSTTGISKYSELDKSMDNVFYVFFDDEMNKENRMKMGSCKTRRGFNIPASFVKVHPRSGMVLDDEQSKTQEVEVGSTTSSAISGVLDMMNDLLPAREDGFV